MWRKQEEQKVPPSPQNVVATPAPPQYSAPTNVQANVPQAAPPRACRSRAEKCGEHCVQGNHNSR